MRDTPPLRARCALPPAAPNENTETQSHRDPEPRRLGYALRFCVFGTVEQEVNGAHACDSVLGGGRHGVKRDDGLWVVVAYGAERRKFPFEDAWSTKRFRDLHVGCEAAAADDKVDFQRVAFSDADACMTPDQFIEHDVFKKVSVIAWTVADKHIAQSCVDSVVLVSCFEKFAPLDVEALGLSEQVCLAQSVHIGLSLR